MGVLIASRRPNHPVGWLFGAVGLLSGLHLFCGEYAIYALVVERGSLAGGRVSAWTVGWLWVPINALLAFVALLFPDGKLPSPRWRLIGWANGVMAVAGSFAAAFLPGPGPWIAGIDNPFGVEGLAGISNLVDASLRTLSFWEWGYSLCSCGGCSESGRVLRKSQCCKWVSVLGGCLGRPFSRSSTGLIGDVLAPRTPRDPPTPHRAGNPTQYSAARD